MKNKMIPLHKTWYGRTEINSVINFLKKRQRFTRGCNVETFEKIVSESHKNKYGIATCNATSALHISVLFSKKFGNKIITTPFSYVASANVALYENMEIIFCDINPKTLLLEEDSLKKIIEENDDIAAVIYVDIFGLLPETYKIKKICHDNNIFLIEDASQAIKSSNGKVSAGNIGDVAIFSFHENKQITTLGEGGMLISNNRQFTDFAKSIRDQGRVSSKNWKNEMTLGYNYRLTEIQALFGIYQFKKIGKNLKRRRILAEKYRQAIEKTPSNTNIYSPDGKNRSWFTFPFLAKSSNQRKKIIESFEKQNINYTIDQFHPIYQLKPHQSNKYRSKILESITERIISIPLYPDMTKKEQDKIIKCIHESSN